MELTLGASFAFVSCVYLLVFTSPASAKCHGKWAIQACFGGNGKRSDPNMNPSSNQDPSLLRRVLISDAQKLDQMLQNENLPPGPVDTLSPSEEGDDEQFNEGFEESYPRSLALNTPEVRDLRRYLRALKLQHALREQRDDQI